MRYFIWACLILFTPIFLFYLYISIVIAVDQEYLKYRAKKCKNPYAWNRYMRMERYKDAKREGRLK